MDIDAEEKAAAAVLRELDNVHAPAVSVILLNWNSWADTVACLGSLADCRYPNYRVVVVDNDSADGSLERIGKWCRTAAAPFSELTFSGGALHEAESPAPPAESGLREVVVIGADVNLGFCAGNNLGAEFAYNTGADFLLFLNNDTVCEPDFIERMVSAARSDRGIGLVGGMVYYEDEPESLWWCGQKLGGFFRVDRRAQPIPAQGGEGFQVDWVVGCLMLMPRDIYRTVGCFDERFFLWYEDVDLSLRIRERGYTLRVAPEARIRHKVSAAIGRLSPMAYYYSARNFLLLSRKHNGAFSHLFHVVYFLLRCNARSLFLVAKGRPDLAAAGSRGLRDYLLGRLGKWRDHDDAASAPGRDSQGFAGSSDKSI